MIEVIGSDVNAVDGFSGTFTIPVPAGVQENDALIAIVAASEAVSWGLFGELIVLTGSDTSTYTLAAYRIASNSEPSDYEFLVGDLDNINAAGIVIALRNTAPSFPVDVYSVYSGSLSPDSEVVLPTLSTTVDDCLLLGCATGQTNAAWTDPGSMSRENVIFGSALNAVLASEPFAAAGATGARTFIPNVSTVAKGVLIAVAPSEPSLGGWTLGAVGWGPAGSVGGTYRIDFLVGGEIQVALNEILIADPSSEVGATAGVFHDPDAFAPLAGNDLTFVRLPAGVTITSFHVEVQFTPGYDGDMDVNLFIEDLADFADLMVARYNDSGTGITGATFDETTATFTLGSMPFTVPVDAVMDVAVVFDPPEAGHEVVSGFLEFTYE